MFSGDVGGTGHPIVRDPTPPPPADYVLIETTYGDRLHRSLSDSVEELWQAVHDTLQRGGNVIIPTFALERSQEILFFLREGVERGRLPASLPVFLDSPMAISATEIMRRHPECFDAQTLALLAKGGSLCAARLALHAGGGGIDGAQPHHRWRRHHGRLGHVHRGPRTPSPAPQSRRGQSSVIFVGYAARGHLARRIIDGERSSRILGVPVQVKARIFTINGFSAHADQSELLAWHASTGQPRMTFLVHGDPDHGMNSMAGLLAQRGRATTSPALHERIELE